MPFCPKCGNAVGEKGKFCDKCGADLHPKEKIGLPLQIILALIPSWITQMIAFYRIKKTKDGAIIEAGLFGVAIALMMLLPFPYGLIVTLAVTIPIPVHFVNKWTRKYNSEV